MSTATKPAALKDIETYGRMVGAPAGWATSARARRLSFAAARIEALTACGRPAAAAAVARDVAKELCGHRDVMIVTPRFR